MSQFVYSKPVSKWYRQDLNWGLSQETQAHLNAAPWCYRRGTTRHTGIVGRVGLWEVISGVWICGRFLRSPYWSSSNDHSPLRLCNPKKRVGNKRVSFFQIFFLDSSDKGRDIISKKAARNGTASWTLRHVPGVVLSKGDSDRGCRHSCPGLKPRGVRSLWGEAQGLEGCAVWFRPCLPPKHPD